NTGAGYFDVSRDGTLAYVKGDEAGNDFSLVWAARDGVVSPLSVPPGTLRSPRVSPHGPKFAVSIYREGRWNIWLGAGPTGTLGKVTYENDNFSPIWTADESSMIFASDRSGTWNIWRLRTDGTGQPERLIPSSDLQYPSDVSPDGRWVVYGTVTQDGNDIMLLDTRDGTAHPFLVRPADDGGAPASPDGRCAVYV